MAFKSFVKSIYKFALLAVIIAISFGCSSSDSSENEPLRIAFISHIYYIYRFQDLPPMFIEDINAANPKYVFALGDVVLFNKDHDWELAFDFFSRLKAKVYYAPGNHDIYNFDILETRGSDRFYPQWRQEYINRIGYTQTMVRDPQADFILINTNDPFFVTQPFLDKSLKKADKDTPTLLLGHHRIWLDRHHTTWFNWFFKTTRKEEMLPYIPKFDQLVIGDLWGKLEHKTIEEIPTAMIGMGNTDKPAFWVYAELQKNGKFSFEQRIIDLPEDHPYHYKPNK